MTITVKQGIDESIIIPNLVDTDGSPLDPTGWAIGAVVRRYGKYGPVVATWSSSPAEGEGQADVIDGDDGKQIALLLTPILSAGWSWSKGWLQCVAKEPDDDQRTARMADDVILLSFNLTEDD